MIHDPKFLQQYLEEQTSDQLFKFELLAFSTITELRLRSLLQADPKMKSWVVICRGRNRFVNELHVHKPVFCNTSSELLGEEDTVKRHEPRDKIRSHQALRELVRNLFGASDPTSFIPEGGIYYETKKVEKYPRMSRIKREDILRRCLDILLETGTSLQTRRARI